MRKTDLYKLTISPEHTHDKAELIFTFKPSPAKVGDALKAMAAAVAVPDDDDDDDDDGYRQDQAADRIAFLDCCYQIAERMQPLADGASGGQTIVFAGVRVGFIKFETIEAWAQ